jgi:hypothetical protein
MVWEVFKEREGLLAYSSIQKTFGAEINKTINQLTCKEDD